VRISIGTALLSVCDIKLVGEAADGEEALRVCETVRPDVVIMGLNVPMVEGLTTVYKLRRRSPESRVLAFTTYPGDYYLHEALLAGARGYLLKQVNLDSLIAAIRATHRGRTALKSEASTAHRQVTARRKWSAPCVATWNLTEREKEVVRLLREGLRNRQIAERLRIAPSTVRYHIQRLCWKLGVSSRADVVAHVVRRLMDLDGSKRATLQAVRG
jgi:DNA-binding NarL/FixJ family response regulator